MWNGRFQRGLERKFKFGPRDLKNAKISGRLKVPRGDRGITLVAFVNKAIEAFEWR